MLSSPRARFSLHSGFNPAALAGRLHKPHVMAEEAKTQGREGTCLRSQGWPVRVEQIKGRVSIWPLATHSGRGQGSFPPSRMLVEKRHSVGEKAQERPKNLGSYLPCRAPSLWCDLAHPHLLQMMSVPLRLRASEFLFSENVPVTQSCKHSWCQWLKGGCLRTPQPDCSHKDLSRCSPTTTMQGP